MVRISNILPEIPVITKNKSFKSFKLSFPKNKRSKRKAVTTIGPLNAPPIIALRRNGSKNQTFFTSHRTECKSVTLKGIKRISTKDDIIKQIFKDDIGWKTKLKRLFRYYLYPHLIAALLTIIVKILASIRPNDCGNGPICICFTVIERSIISVTDIFGYWMIWILVILFEVYQKLFRCLIFLMSFIFIYLFYLLSDADSFNWFPIYIFLLLVKFSRFFFLVRKFNIKEMLFMGYKSQGCGILLIVNYAFLFFLAKNFKDYVQKPWIDIFYSLYFLLFFLILKHFLVIFGTYAYDHNSQNQQQNFLMISVSRIALSYFISFTSSNFTQFKFNDIGQYLLIFSYSNNLITLYTRFNLFEFVTMKLYRFIVKKPKNTQQNEQSINIQKILSGCTLDITFISSIRLLIYHIWEGNILYSNCDYESTELVGIIIFIILNMVLTFSILFFMIYKGEALFTYKGQLNVYMNIYLLYLTHVLFEITISFFARKL